MVTQPTDRAEMREEHTGSDNGCSVPLRNTNRKKRPAQVGIRGRRGVSTTLAERLAARTHINPTTGCWEFAGSASNAYGHMQVLGDTATRTRKLAHRASWELKYGPIPNGLHVCHRCDNPRCINPDHLFLGTHAANMRDAVNKGRKNCFGRQKLTALAVFDIYARARQGERHIDIAMVYGIARHSVWAIVHGRSWKHLFSKSGLKVASRRPQQVREQHNPGTEFGDVHSGESMHTAARNRPNSFGAR